MFDDELLNLFFYILKVGMFHRLMSRVAQNAEGTVELYYRQIFMPFQDNHRVLIEMVPPPQALIKVGVFTQNTRNTIYMYH